VRKIAQEEAMNNIYDFSSALPQKSFDLIPNGTIAKVSLTIQPGGHNDITRGWTDGLVSINSMKEYAYLKIQCNILSGEYSGRKIWSRIGLYSSKSEKVVEIGRSFIRSILESARSVIPNDTSDEANKKRSVQGLIDLDDMVFVAKVSVAKNQNGEPQNEIKYAVTPDHPEYKKHISDDSTNSNVIKPFCKQLGNEVPF